jgi:hypothetical protein
MNKLVATLATTTVLFAGTTLYFWRELEARAGGAVTARDVLPMAAAAEPTAGTAATANASARVSPGPMPGAAAANVAANVAGTGAPPNAGAAAAADPSREMALPFARDFLRQYDDPAQRTSLLKAARAGIESQYSRLKERLRLDPSTFGQFVDLIAEEQLEQQANYFRCLVVATCDTSKVGPPRDRSSEYLALLGSDGYSQYTAYRDVLPEWQSVVQLRGRLPEANYLKDSDADRLLSALAAERARYSAEAGQAGAKLRGWGNGTGMVWYSGDGGAEEQLASAIQYSDRMRERAASILTAEQLRAFIQLQEEMLANLANYLRSQSGKSG